MTRVKYECTPEICLDEVFCGISDEGTVIREKDRYVWIEWDSDGFVTVEPIDGTGLWITFLEDE